MARNQNESRSAASYPRSFIRWLQLKNYQYEVTFSLYMLTYTEKIIFNSILFILISLLVTAAFFYLPNHVCIIYNRILYYLSGEFAHMPSGSSLTGKISDTLHSAKEIVISHTIEAAASNTLQAAKQAVAQGVKDEI